MFRRIALALSSLILVLLLASCGEGGPENKPPLASMEFEPRFGDAPLTVHFSAATSTDPDGQIASYSWNFGDGAKGNGLFAEHEYTKSGSFVVTLTVTDDKGASSSVKQTVFITEPPAPKARTDTTENELVIYTRTLPEAVKAGETFSVQVMVTAKINLRALLVSETLPPGVQLVSGDLRAAQLSLSVGQKLQLTYQAKAGAALGSFTLSGKATPATDEGAQPSLELNSNVQVR